MKPTRSKAPLPKKNPSEPKKGFVGDRREPTDPFDSAAVSPLSCYFKRDHSCREGQMESRIQYILEAAALEQPTAEFTAFASCCCSSFSSVWHQYRGQELKMVGSDNLKVGGRAEGNIFEFISVIPLHRL